MADHQSLAEALAAFQAEVPKMQKDETAKVKSDKANYTYGYAGLDQFVEVVEPVLGKHGLSVTGVTTWEDGQFVAAISLLHESGEKMTSYWPLPDPRRFGPQDIGSALTYARRYLGWLMSGTFPGGIDDDGQQAQQSARESWDSAKPRQERPVSAPPAQKAPKDWSKATDGEVVNLLSPMPTAEIEKAINVYDWMAARDLHKRVVEMDYEGQPVQVTATDLIAGRIADEAVAQDATVASVKKLQELANDRGLMKVQVSGTETLAEALYSAQELAQHAEDQSVPGAAEASANPVPVND